MFDCSSYNARQFYKSILLSWYLGIFQDDTNRVILIIKNYFLFIISRVLRRTVVGNQRDELFNIE